MKTKILLPFGYGIDIVDLSRSEFDDPEFSKRYMTKKEYEYGKRMYHNNLFAYRNYNAAIWSLKESIIKATNHKVIFSEIEIKYTNEAPQCLLKNYKLYLTLSFEKTMLVSSALCYKKEEED